MPLNLPPQGTIDRRERYESFMVRILVPDPETGQPLEEVLWEESGGCFGPHPGDPSPWLRPVPVLCW